MLSGGVEQAELIVGNLSFGLVEKDAKFARWDARKSLRYGDNARRVRVHELFEGVANDVLIGSMVDVHSSIAQMEAEGLTRPQVLQRLLTDNPNLPDYMFLFRKAPWGAMLMRVLQREEYATDERGELWSEFIMGRVHRALGGDLERFPRYDGGFSYQINTDLAVLRFDPESTALLNDGPQIHIRGNRIPKVPNRGFDTDQRYRLELNNITRIQIHEWNEEVKFIKLLGDSELHLIYQQQPIGSTNQIELRTVTQN